MAVAVELLDRMECVDEVRYLRYESTWAGAIRAIRLVRPGTVCTLVNTTYNVAETIKMTYRLLTPFHLSRPGTITIMLDDGTVLNL